MLIHLIRKVRRRERGSALINVIAIVAVSATVVVAVSTSIFAAGGVTTTSRASVQSKAAAEAGIDWALGEFNRGYFPCASDASQLTANPAFAVTINYKSSSGTSLACGTSVTGSPATATISSTGYANLKSTQSTLGNVHTMAATASITLASSGSLLDRAVFTEASLSLTNNSVISASSTGALDGDLYTNGSFTCLTQNKIEGTIVARGDVTVTNICTAMESVWSGGNVDLQQSSVNLNSDVYAAGSVKLNTAHIGGNVVANGNVVTTDSNGKSCGSFSANVCGSIWSLNGTITLGNNGTPIGGGLYARGNIVQGSQNSLSPSFAGVVSLNGALQLKLAKVAGTIKVYGNIDAGDQNNTPNKILDKTKTCSVTVTSTYWTTCAATDLVLPLANAMQATVTPVGSTNLGTRAEVVSVDLPPRQSFPQIFSSATAIGANWGGWTQPSTSAEIATMSAMCGSSSAFQSGLTTILGNYAAGTKILLNMPCTSAIPGDNVNMTLKGDLAIMSKYGLNWNNETKVGSTGGPYSLMLIVPSDAPGISWAAPTGAPTQLTPTCSGTRDLSINKLVASNSTRIFLYTPCAISIPNNNGTAFDGQIYSGSGSYAAGLLIKRAVMTIPGVVVAGSSGSGSNTTTAVITSRYDVG